MSLIREKMRQVETLTKELTITKHRLLVVEQKLSQLVLPAASQEAKPAGPPAAAAAPAAGTGAGPKAAVPGAPENAAGSLWKQYLAIKDPTLKTRFWERHAADLRDEALETALGK